MLEHQKLILQKVSYDKELFRKELIKSIQWLKPHEIYKLLKWVKDNYYESHKEVISEAFDLVAA